MKEEDPYPECRLCRTIDDCKHKDRPNDGMGIDLPPDVCPKPMNIMRRTLRKRKANKNKN